MADGEHANFLVQLFYLGSAFSIPLWHLAEGLLELFLERGYVRLSALLLRRRQLLKLLRTDDLAPTRRCEGQPHRRADEGQATLLSPALELGQHPVLPLTEFLLDVLSLPAVVFALKSCRDRGAQLLDETFHVTAKPACTTGWEPQSVRFVSFGEVIDIAPIWWGRLFGGLAFEIPTHH